MAISTNSIIHYTKSLDVLCKILDEGFKIKYCLENLALISKGKGSSAAHPMVSFCDIPLSEADKHFEAYGYYGIGLYKKWALENGLNPVLYIEKNSSMAISIHNMLVEIRGKKDSDIAYDILKLKSFAKNYSGELNLGEVSSNNYKFYDEREWRFVSEEENISGVSISISGNSYKNDKSKYNDKLSDFRLKFSPSDISYIIVEKVNDIPLLVKHLRDSYYDKCSARELDILLTKICSIEQIASDY